MSFHPNNFLNNAIHDCPISFQLSWNRHCSQKTRPISSLIPHSSEAASYPILSEGPTSGAASTTGGADAELSKVDVSEEGEDTPSKKERGTPLGLKLRMFPLFNSETVDAILS